MLYENTWKCGESSSFILSQPPEDIYVSVHILAKLSTWDSYDSIGLLKWATLDACYDGGAPLIKVPQFWELETSPNN